MEHGVKWFACNLCYFKSKKETNLDSHKSLHPVENLFSCKECSFKTAWSSYLDHHISTVHSLKNTNKNLPKNHNQISKTVVTKTFANVNTKNKKIQQKSDFEEVMKDIEKLFAKHNTRRDIKCFHIKNIKGSDVSCTACNEIVIDEMNVKMEVIESTTHQPFFETAGNIDISTIKREIDVDQDFVIDGYDSVESSPVDAKVELDENALPVKDIKIEMEDRAHGFNENMIDMELTAICKNINGKSVTLYRCPICKGQFMSLTSYDEHVRSCHLEIIQRNLYTSLKVKHEVKKIEFACDFCNIKCTNMKAHVEAKHKDKFLSCNICSFRCKSSLTLKRHVNTHKVYHCNFCTLKFTKYQKYINHRREHPKHSCEYCQIEYSSLSTLMRHREKCKKKKLGIKVPKPMLECDKCEFKSDFKNVMKLHVHQLHKGQKVYICEICKFRCFREVSMVYHKMQHSGIQPFCCEKCPYRSNTRYHLTEHRLTHIDSLVCKVCSAKFKSTRYFNKHMLTHSEYQPFVCKVCNIPFKTKQYLNYHTNIHNDTMRFFCKKCSFKCKRQSQLKEHVMAHHDKTFFTCKSCNVVYKTLRHFKTHMLSHKNPLDQPTIQPQK